MTDTTPVTFRFFAMMRERLGFGELQVDLGPTATVSQAQARARELLGDAAPLVDRSMVMVNQEYAGPETPLEDGDEVAFIPPVSGGERDHVRVHADSLDPEMVAMKVVDVHAGAVNTFVGFVRNNARGRDVSGIDYEAYPAAAEKMLSQIIGEIRAKWPVIGVAIEHRTGLLSVGEASVAISVSSAHRDAAFAATAYAIERIKEIVPIWKKEYYADGDAWIGSEHDYQVETGRIVSAAGQAGAPGEDKD
jgi:molybdopterin synthase catalytic subunit